PPCGGADDASRRDDRHDRHPTRERGRLLLDRARLQAQAAHDPLRADRHRDHGCDRRLRRHRAPASHVRHLPLTGDHPPLMRSLPRSRTRRHDDEAGFTLGELLVTVTIMGISFVIILGGIAVFSRATTVQRGSADLDTAMRTYVEQLVAAPYDA